jgi:hypothetical protein
VIPPVSHLMSPPRTLAELQQSSTQTETVLPVATARVVFANYDLLRHDFPQILNESFTGNIDRWILENAAVVSQGQACQTRVNSLIQTRGEGVMAFRPPRYGRSVVRPVELEPGVGGLLDVKGAGVAPGVIPRHGNASNGLLLLAKALAEATWQGLIEAIFRHAESQFYTLPVYAVLDLGFDVLLAPETGLGVPAGALVRQAHRRVLGGNEMPKQDSSDHQILLEIELLLRHYGVTSEGEAIFRFVETESGLRLLFRDASVSITDQVTLRALRDAVSSPGRMAVALDGTNIQAAHPLGVPPVRALLVDFGQYEVRRRFEDPLMSLVVDRPYFWGGLVRPEDPCFVQPRPELRVAEEEWGVVALSPEQVACIGYPASCHALTRVEHLCLELAWRFRRGEMTGEEIRSRLDAMVAHTASCWPEA